MLPRKTSATSKWLEWDSVLFTHLEITLCLNTALEFSLDTPELLVVEQAMLQPVYQKHLVAAFVFPSQKCEHMV